MKFGEVSKLRRARSKSLALHIKNRIWKARAFLPSMDGQVQALTWRDAIQTSGAALFTLRRTGQV